MSNYTRFGAKTLSNSEIQSMFLSWEKLFESFMTRAITPSDWSLDNQILRNIAYYVITTIKKGKILIDELTEAKGNNRWLIFFNCFPGDINYDMVDL